MENFIRDIFLYINPEKLFPTFGMLSVRVTGRDAVEGDDVAVGGGHPVLFSRVTEWTDDVWLQERLDYKLYNCHIYLKFTGCDHHCKIMLALTHHLHRYFGVRRLADRGGGWHILHAGVVQETINEDQWSKEDNDQELLGNHSSGRNGTAYVRVTR